MDNYFSSKDILNKAIGTDAYFQIKSILFSLKAADVAEVRHGTWIVTDVVTCSECRHFCWHSIKWTDRGTRQDMYLCLWYARTSWTCPSPKSQPYGMATGKKPAMEMVSSALSAAVIFVLSPMRQSGFGVVLTAAL